jgi:hypothetical protein
MSDPPAAAVIPRHRRAYRPSTPLEQIIADVIAEKRTILTAQ